MAKVIWKENKVISIETENGVFVLAQMLVSPYLLVFDKFSEGNQWRDVDLKIIPILCCKAVTRQFTSNSNIFYQKDIEPILKPKVQRYWIKLNPSACKIKIWGGTSNEMEVMVIGKGGGALIEQDIYAKGVGNKKIIIPKIPLSDVDVISNHETTSVEISPSFNKRLYLCYILKRNVDPIKELVFDMRLPEVYKDFFESIKK